MNISEEQLQEMVTRGVVDAVSSNIRNGYWLKTKIDELLQSSFRTSGPKIESAIRDGIFTACNSLKFQEALQQQLIALLAQKYVGAFEGVIRAAAKESAKDTVLVQRLVDLVKESTMRENSNDATPR